MALLRTTIHTREETDAAAAIPREGDQAAALAAIEDGPEASRDGRPRDRLPPLIERTFRYAYMMAPKMRAEMLAEERGGTSA